MPVRVKYSGVMIGFGDAISVSCTEAVEMSIVTATGVFPNDWVTAPVSDPKATMACGMVIVRFS